MLQLNSEILLFFLKFYSSSLFHSLLHNVDDSKDDVKESIYGENKSDDFDAGFEFATAATAGRHLQKIATFY